MGDTGFLGHQRVNEVTLRLALLTEIEEEKIFHYKVKCMSARKKKKKNYIAIKCVTPFTIMGFSIPVVMMVLLENCWMRVNLQAGPIY